LGAPIVATVAWYHGARGLKRVSGPELTIITILLFIAGSLLWAFGGARDEKKLATSLVAPSTPSAGAASVPAAPRTAVAVLPFANLTGDASKEYLGDGMAEELINTLTKVSGLKVPARTSTFAYKGRNTDIRQIAKDLGVGTILEGSVRAAGKRLRITAQLINAQDGLHLWSETYDEEFTDIFMLQDKLAQAIVQAMQVNLGGASIAVLGQEAMTADVEAYNLYMQGNALIQRLSPENVSRATELCRQAVTRDPNFARGYDCIANAQMNYALLSQQSYESFATAENAARKALAIDPRMTSARLTVATLAGFRGQWVEAEARVRATLELAANDALVHMVHSFQLLDLGHLRDALREAHTAYDLAPANPSMVAVLAEMLWMAGEDDQAERYANLANDLGLSNSSDLLRGIRLEIALKRRHYDDAITLADTSFDAKDADWSRTASLHKLAYSALAGKGNRDAVLKARERLYPRPTQARTSTIVESEACIAAASAFVYIGMVDAAYDLVNQCLAGLKSPYTSTGGNAVDRFWSPLMRPFIRDARFQTLSTRLGWMDYWRQFGPPDDCDIKNNHLTCH
jgi:TolB-like protein